MTASALPPLSLYVHLPWCVQKCPYCDFNSHSAGKHADFGRYVDAIVSDIAMEADRSAGRTIETIFLGGGTPSLFSPEQIETILQACARSMSIAESCEITMEANPGTVERGSLAGYRRAGVTRLSIGAQSFSLPMLKRLGRIHDIEDINKCFDEALAADFASINVDVMFGLPGQDVAAAAADVDALVSLAPPHVSYYQLTLEPNTVFHREPPTDLPDEDVAWDIQVQGHEKLSAAGYEQYEISAFAMPGHRCRHNVNYWRFGDYLAVGAGAPGQVTDESGAVFRYQKPAHPRAFIEHTLSGQKSEPSPVADSDLPFEFMLNVLRLSDGFSLELLAERTGLGEGAIGKSVDAAIGDGLLEKQGAGHWRPTPRGHRFLNELQARFLP